MASRQHAQNEDTLTLEDRQVYLSSREGERKLETLWMDEIKKNGAVEAYEMLKSAYVNAEPGEGHIEAHLFGSALYKTLGIAGVTTCDGELELGCYHEFIGSAIVNEGLGAVQRIDAICNTLPYVDFLGCQHGIGHGLVGYFGYDAPELNEALTMCNTLQNANNTNGCYSGALMEYNVRTMLYMDRVPVRELVGENYLEPCDSIPTYAQESCYFWQPEWWKIVLNGNGLDEYAFMGTLCARTDEPNRSTCYKGLGQSTSKTNSDAATAIALCEAATENGTPKAAVQCLDNAVPAFTENTDLFRASAKDACNEVVESGEAYSVCAD